MTTADVIDLMKKQAATWICRRESVDNNSNGDEIDTLVESSVMYQLLADMALQHAELVGRIKPE